jgi:hypothetical protein
VKHQIKRPTAAIAIIIPWSENLHGDRKGEPGRAITASHSTHDKAQLAISL